MLTISSFYLYLVANIDGFQNKASALFLSRRKEYLCYWDITTSAENSNNSKWGLEYQIDVDC